MYSRINSHFILIEIELVNKENKIKTQLLLSHRAVGILAEKIDSKSATLDLEQELNPTFYWSYFSPKVVSSLASLKISDSKGNPIPIKKVPQELENEALTIALVRWKGKEKAAIPVFIKKSDFTRAKTMKATLIIKCKPIKPADWFQVFPLKSLNFKEVTRFAAQVEIVKKKASNLEAKLRRALNALGVKRKNQVNLKKKKSERRLCFLTFIVTISRDPRPIMGKD